VAAQYKRTKIENEVEKDILTGAIVSTPFLEQTRKTLHLNLIEEPTIRRVVSWCLDHFDRFGEAPGTLIHDIFASRKREMDEDTSDTTYNVLQHVNKRYIENPDTFSDRYYIAKAQDYMEERSLVVLADQIKGHVTTGNVDMAKRALLDYNKVDPVVNVGVQPFRDPAFIHSMFANMKKGMIEFPYPALQALFRDVYRGDILAVAGPAKRGKSFLMFQLGYYALYNNLNVAVFSYEMDKDVMGMRLFQNFMGQTRHETEEVPVPYFDEKGMIQYEYKDKGGLDLQETVQFQDAFSKFSGVGELFFFDHDHCGRKVSDIADALDRVEKYEDAKIDVVVIDYDKLLENENGFRGASHDAVDQIWKDVKAKIAQDRDSLVVFGSQYNKMGAKYEVGPQEASGSSRKFDYASHWVSILQSEAEKRAGIMRLSVLGRHDEFYQSDKVVCLQSLALARPILDARWMKEIPNYDEIVMAQQSVVDEGMNSEEQDGGNKKNQPWGFHGELS
jgi:hypothetical protein